MISGVWDGVLRETVTEGISAGDSRVEKQEWHLDQKGNQVSGYYLAALTFTSGDGRPYVCSRQTSFSTLVRFDVSGRVQDGTIELKETTQRASQGRCAAGERPLAQYRAQVHGDVLTLVADGQHQTLYRNRGTPQDGEMLAAVAGARADETMTPSLGGGPSVPADRSTSSPVDVSGVWIWEHRGAIPTGDEKQEREEWHVDQDGERLSGYYDRVVREISTDGHAFKCSMDTEFEIATRYKFRGEVRGNQLLIYENSYEVLEPSACDNGKRRLDAYEGMANGDEVRLIWGVGGQVLRRPRPDVPTQRF
ncbi:MAG: hypothetical protein ABUL67_03125 [Haliangium ochraceum]